VARKNARRDAVEVAATRSGTPSRSSGIDRQVRELSRSTNRRHGR
jgi:hypothetical protein